MMKGMLLALVASALTGALASMEMEASRELQLERAWGRTLSAHGQAPPPPREKKSPIQRVVGLLTEMKTELEKEAEKDDEIYDKMVCWCETSEKEKKKAIADAETKDKELTAEIEERSAKHGVLSTEIAATKDELAELKTSVAESDSMREKEAGEFMAEEKDMIQAITNLKNAIAVLSKHHGGSLAQLSSKMQMALGAVLQDVSLKHEMMMGDQGRATRSNLHTVLLAIQTTRERSGAVPQALRGALNLYDEEGTTGRFDALPAKFAERVLARAAKEQQPVVLMQQPAGAGESYAPASGQIFGILKQMKEEFETNLAASQKEEAKAQDDHTALGATKEEQIAAAKQKIEDMQNEHANNKKALYDAKEDLELTRNQRTADVKFLQNLKLTCNDLDKQFEERSKMRTEEIKAVSEAIAIITEDDSRELMAKTTSFVQTSMSSKMAMRMTRSRAAAVLRNALAAPEFGDLLDAWRGRGSNHMEDTPRMQLALLTTSVQLDSFTKVKEAMDAMVAELKDQQKEEVKLKEFCTTEFNENEKQTYEKTEESKDLQEKIDGLTATVEKLGKEIAEATEEIATTKLEIKKASQSREEENAEFQTTVADQRATQVILKKALEKLEAFYKKKTAMLQESQDQTPPVQFTPMKKSGGASPVMSMIESIIEESMAVEKEAVAGEKSAQADYEKFVKDSNALIKELKESITEKTKGKSMAEDETEQAKSDLSSTQKELDALNSYKADLHEQCDFILKNFDIRQKARMNEIEAIQEAKGILSGASFVQR